jgi:hypothetical protein
MKTKQTDTQLELHLQNRQRCAARASSRRRTNAQRWFNRMRQIVDNAVEWRPAPTPRPYQTCFAGPLAPRTPSVETRTNHEHQLAE